MKNKTIEYFLKNFKRYNSYLQDNIREEAYKQYNILVNKYKDDPKKLKKQTLNNMFPVISVYKSLLINNIEQKQAFFLVDKINSQKKLEEAKSTSKILHMFGLYKLYPSIFKKVTLSSFSSDIGFDPEFIVINKKQCKFNMKKCIFCERCKQENCFELTPVFCHTDIVFNTNLHPNIIWHRDYTLSEDGPYCDFDVKLKEE